MHLEHMSIDVPFIIEVFCANWAYVLEIIVFLHTFKGTIISVLMHPMLFTQMSLISKLIDKDFTTIFTFFFIIVMFFSRTSNLNLIYFHIHTDHSVHEELGDFLNGLELYADNFHNHALFRQKLFPCFCSFSCP